MNGLKAYAKKLICLSMAACTALTMMSVTAFAEEPYEPYSYDNWDDAIPSQAGYTVDRTVSGMEMELDRLSDPADPLFYSEDASDSLNGARDFDVFEDSETWIADTGNSRIIVLDSNFKVKARYYGVTGTSSVEGIEQSADGKTSMFNEPYGLKITISPTTGKKTLYVADYSNSRVVRAEVASDTELILEQEYTKPEESLYTSKTFNPSKVQVDFAENVYVVVKSVNTGSVQFKADGSFTGFYGANRVEVTAKVVAQKLWRKIASNEQIAGMSRNVPVEYANFDMDKEGFIYTVTEVKTDTDAVKKINPAGYNIWDNVSGDEYTFGDNTAAQYDMTTKKSHSTKLTDIAVDDNGIMNILDYETGRVFQYDRLANLICIFGTTSSTADQRGSFTTPNAVETFGDTVMVLEGSKTRNDITIFKKTVFGENLHKAFEYYDEGLYLEAAPYWEEIVKRDGGYTYAHIGLGKADLKNGNYYSAMERFKIAHSRRNYDKAFEYYRDEWLQDHFTIIAVIVGVLVVVWLVRKIVKFNQARTYRLKHKG